MAGVRRSGTSVVKQTAARQSVTLATIQPEATVHQGQCEVTIPLHLHEKQILKQQQSLQMVQIMLHVSIGTLCYLREFLPLRCFDDRDLKQAQRDRRYSYSEFVANEPVGAQESVPRSHRNGQPLKVLLRHSDPKADTLLDLLEHGVFDALRRKVLDAIQLTVVTDKDSPSNVLESYTFSFKYAEGYDDMEGHLQTLSLDPVGCLVDMGTTQSARLGLEMIIRRLITLSAFLPVLPNKRSLAVHLLYTDNCPPDYEPPGFIRSTSETVRYPCSNDWTRESQSCGTMDSGDYKVGLRVTSLKWLGRDADDQENVPPIPSDLRYTDEVARVEDVGFTEVAKDSSEFASANGQMEVSDDDLDASQGSIGTTNALHSIPQSTQTRHDHVERNMLRSMLPAASPSRDSDLVPTQPLTMAVSGGLMSEPVEKKMLLSQSKISDIEHHCQSKHPFATRQSEAGAVKCQCGWNGTDSEMLECHFCHRQQHASCYGYESIDDRRRPDIHACYECLLQPNETQLLQEMNTLVLLRRAIMIIRSDGFPRTTLEFAEKLHCNGHTVIQITELLKKQKFLLPAPGSRKKGFARTGLPRFVINEDPDIRKKMDQVILNPLAKIGHLYTECSMAANETAPSSQRMEGLSPDCGLYSNSRQDMDSQETESDDDEQLSSLNAGVSRKRRQPGDAGDAADEVEKIATAAQTSSSNHAGSHRNGSGSRGAPAPVELRKSNAMSAERTPKGSLRRSSRKRRKTSHYSPLIDVGYATSDDGHFRQ